MLDVISFEACGKRYELRPDFKALLGIERETGKKLLVFAVDLEQGKAGLEDIAIILSHGLRSGSGEVSQDEIGKIIDDVGFIDTGLKCVEFFTRGIQGPKKPPTPAGG